MNSDATEAALGLLGLSPLNASQSHPHPQPHPHNHVAHAHGPSLTSTSVGVAVDRTLAPHIVPSPLPPSLVPLKRKQPSPILSSPLSPIIPRDGLSPKPRQPSHPLATSSTPPVPTKSLAVPMQRHPQQRLFSPATTTSAPPQNPPASQLPLASPSSSQHPLTLADVPPPPDSDAISCICGFTYDDGFSIACDDCSRWCHAACFGIVQGGEVPEFWKCWVCDPTVRVDRERAAKIQKGRLRAMRTKASHGTNGGASGPATVNGHAGHTTDEAGKPMSRRKTSPGAERKSRRGSAVAAAIEGSGSSRKKRRASILSPVDPSSSSIPPSAHSAQSHAGSSRISYPNGNDPVRPSALPPTPMTFPPDIYPNPSVYSQLLRVAKAWRGVTALNPPSPLLHPPPKSYDDRGYMRVDSQGYRDRYGYSMSPLDNTTPVILDENVRDVYSPRTVLQTDSLYTNSTLQYPPPSTCTPAHLRPPSPKLHVASDPLPSSQTSIYPSPPTSSHMSPSVPILSHPRPCAKSPLTPSTNIALSSSPNDMIPATTLLAPYTAAIIPSAAYLADPLNGYAHLGMGKPQVRLVGGGWEIGLDARGTGGMPDPSDSADKASEKGMKDIEDGKARWARCGCWPNAVVRPVICSETRRRNGKEGHRPECAKAGSDDGAVSVDGGVQSINGRSVPPPVSRLQAQHTDESSDQDDTHSASESDADPTSLSFALFALRDLRADEEIVLGWEWDDGHAVHMLPALMESPGLFAPAHLHHLRAQFTSILHALSSTFTTCACGSSTRDCAVRVMESVVQGRWPWPGGEMTEESESDSSGVGGESGECDDGEIDVEGDGHLDPSRNWGLGMNMDVDVEVDASVEVDRRTRRVKKRKVRKKNKTGDAMLVDGGEVDVAVPTKTKKVIDLGPLVGVKRGFRTREKEPMNGGWGGVEIVPSSLRPFPPLGVEEDGHQGGKGKGKARGEDDIDVDPSPSALPPRMRKVWAPFPAARPEPKAEKPPDHSKERQKTLERWRSPPEMNLESPISVSGAAEGRGKTDPTKPSSVSGDGEDGIDGQETEFDTETEADELDDTRQMPPPPMPASLDPTTVSSLAHATRSSSPRGSIRRDKNGVAATGAPPRAPIPTSGRLSQPLHQESAISVAPDPNTTPSVSSQADSFVLPSSTSFPLAMQSQVQSDLSVLVHSHSNHLTPSVSPSATFSKLSLHSPDASSPHTSVLFSPSEPTSLASASTLIQRTSNLRAPSPPYHRPSKPLHVHPLNESPSFSTPLSAPVVILNSPDGMRDTPAEAQYQQPYRSSPESRHNTDPLSDCHANGEAYCVRFASPEILCGLPGLKGIAIPNNSGPDDGLSVDSKISEVVGQETVPSLDHDAMDVDATGDKDNEREVDITSSPAEVSENKVNHLDECSSLPVPGSPLSQPLSGPRRHTSPSAMDDVAPESHPSPGSVDGTASQAEPMFVDSNPAQLTRELSPPPPPKVKMSLKDFALRKKKQREEEMAAKALHSPAASDKAVLPPSDVPKDLAGDASLGQATGSVVNGHVGGMNGVTKENIPDQFGSMQDKIHVSGCTEDEVTEGSRLSTLVQTSSTISVTKTAEAMLLRAPNSFTDFPRVLDEEHDTDQTQKGDYNPLATLTAKMEIMDATLPSVPVSADDCAPDVVSFAPEPPPPPPLTIEQTSETAVVDRAVPTNSMPQLVVTLNPVPTSALTSMSTSTSTSAANSRSNSVSLPPSISNSTPQPHHHFPTPSSVPPSRRPSHEDGEITNSTPPKTYLPRSHTPPTQPRSFNATHSPSPNFGPTSSSTIPIPRRPVPPLSRSPLSNAAGPTSTPSSSRPLPSGPRALRGSMTQSTHAPPYSSTRPPYAGSQYIPRGPSADRDRIDWDRDRPWAAQRPRGRAGSNGWGR